MLKGWKNTEENIDRSKIVAVDNTFATETFPDDISSKSPEVFKKCYNVEPDGQTSFAKGQIISECPYEIIISPKIPTKKFPRFLP